MQWYIRLSAYSQEEIVQIPACSMTSLYRGPGMTSYCGTYRIQYTQHFLCNSHNEGCISFSVFLTGDACIIILQLENAARYPDYSYIQSKFIAYFQGLGIKHHVPMLTRSALEFFLYQNTVRLNFLC